MKIILLKEEQIKQLLEYDYTDTALFLDKGSEGEVFKTSRDGKYVIKMIFTSSTRYERVLEKSNKLTQISHPNFNTPILVKGNPTAKTVEVASKKLQELSTLDKQLLYENVDGFDNTLIELMYDLTNLPEESLKYAKRFLNMHFRRNDFSNFFEENVRGIIDAAYHIKRELSLSFIDMHAGNIMQDNGTWKIIDI